MYKISIFILLSYVMVFTIIDPTAGGDPLPSNIVNRPNTEAGKSLVAEKVPDTKFVNHGSTYLNNIDCDLTKGCDPEYCCERGQKCGYNNGYFYCYHP